MLMYGGTDLAFARAQSSGGFDLLSEDFNRPLLLLLLAALALLVIGLRNAYRRKLRKAAWS